MKKLHSSNPQTTKMFVKSWENKVSTLIKPKPRKTYKPFIVHHSDSSFNPEYIASNEDENRVDGEDVIVSRQVSHKKALKKCPKACISRTNDSLTTDKGKDYISTTKKKRRSNPRKGKDESSRVAKEDNVRKGKKIQLDEKILEGAPCSRKVNVDMERFIDNKNTDHPM
ncbi:hypothetical protein SUGI_1172800 [Cryptomeria japonica]|nr:hypothetical protein SUGI_1172800 [Cryptomeria japonica]